ncbi:uncharacterized protein LOC111346856 [Stylophora pistillata]|uniref:uncharacterized protein LOC111346856 n=1 Tax=Stylophora pistillata TaxID=50429 RepID=UPI000C0493DF|nr:uncharacterized protein LOC111346856 [Stylophora pistillata]
MSPGDSEEKPSGMAEVESHSSSAKVYKWSQDSEDITIKFDLPEGTKKNEITCNITADSVDLQIGTEVLLSGPLYAKVNSEESTWTVEENSCSSQAAQRGKIDMQVTNDDLNCQYVSFSGKFSGDGNRVSVFASIRYGKKSSGVHELAFIWIEDVTTSRFKACLVKSGKSLRGKSALIDWFAFQGSQPGVFHGQTRFNLFTTGSRCNWVNFPQAFSSVPKIHVTVQHGIPNKDQDSMNVWIANVSTNRFEVCLQESTTFSGLHDKLSVNWMAYEHYPSVWEVKESSVVKFSENDVPSERDSYALCKNVSFSSPFYTAPVVLNTVINGDSGNANSGCPAKGPLITWLEEVTTSYIYIYIYNSAGYNVAFTKLG